MNETTTKFKVDISELKKGIQDANRQIKLANAEFKAAASGMDNWQNSTEGVQKKIDQLRTVLTAQRSILESYKKQLELTVREYGEGSKEADELRIKIANQQTVVNNTERSIRDYTSRLNDLQRAEEGAAEGATEEANALEKLKKTISDQEKELATLKDRYKAVVLEQGENSAEAKALARQIRDLSGDLESNRDRLQEVDGAADDLDASFSGATEGAEKAGEGFTVFKGVLADLVATGIKAAIDGLKNLASTAKEAWKEYDRGRDAVIKATGATGDAAKELTDIYGNVAKSVGGDLETIGDTLGEVNTRFGFTGDQLEAATERFMKFADVTGTDAKTAVQLVSRAMGDAGIRSLEYSTLLDDLAVAAQASGISVEKLTEMLTKYGAPMRALGLETQDAIAIFANWEKAGVNTETAFAGMKAAIGKWSKAGKDARQEFKRTLDEIADAPSIAAATSMAIEAFGQKAGPDLADAIQGGRFEYEAFLDLLSGSDGAVLNTFAETKDATDNVKLSIQSMRVTLAETVDAVVQKYSPEIQSAIEKITPVVQDVIQFLAEKIPPVIEGIKEAFTQLAPVIQAAFDTFMPVVKSALDVLGKILKEAFQWIVDNGDLVVAALGGIGAAIIAWNIATVVANIMKFIQAVRLMGAAAAFAAAKQWLLNTALMANPIGAVVTAIAGLVTAFIILWKRSDKFRQFWLDLWDEIQAVTERYIEAIAGFFSAAWDGIKNVWGKVSGFFSGIWSSIQETAQGMIEAVVGFFAGAWNKIKSAWESVKGFFTGIWSAIQESARDKIEAVAGFFSAARDAVKAVWTGVSDFFAEIWDGIKETAQKAVSAIETVFSPFVEFFTAVWNIVKELGEGCWKAIQAIWKSASDWFNTKLIQPLYERFRALWESLRKLALPAVNAIKTAFSAALAAIKKAWGNVTGFFSKIWNQLQASAKSLLNAVVGFFSSSWERVKAIASAVYSWFDLNIAQPIKTLFRSMWDAVSGAAGAAWSAVTGAWESVSGWFKSAVIEPVSGFFGDMWDRTKDSAGKAWTATKTAWDASKNWFKNNVISPVGNFFTSMWDGLKSGGATAWDAVKSTFGSVADWFREKFSAAWQAVKDVFSTGGKVFDGVKEGIVSAFKTVVNAIIRGINKVIALPFNAINGMLDKISGVSIAGTYPFEGLVSRLPVPEIPQLARGGVLKRGQVGLLEGNGAEAVVPLENNRKWIAATARQLQKALTAEGLLGGSGAGESTSSTSYTFNQYNTSPKALSRLDLYRQSMNLLRMRGAT